MQTTIAEIMDKLGKFYDIKKEDNTSWIDMEDGQMIIFYHGAIRVMTFSDGEDNDILEYETGEDFPQRCPDMVHSLTIHLL